MKALIVEDNPVDRELLSKLLERCGVEVKSVPDPSSAKLALRTDPCDLIFIDLTLEGASGFDLLSELKNESAKKVVVSGSDDIADIEKALGLGADEYLFKPVARQALLEKCSLLGISFASHDKTTVDRDAAPEPAKVLIVDDSATVRALLRRMILADKRLSVVGAAPDGKAALAMIDRLRPDIVTLDLEMPVLDGISALKEARAKYPRLPIVIFSSLSLYGAVKTVEALEAGATDFLPKPNEDENWDVTVRELVGKLIALAEPGSSDQMNETAGTLNKPPQSLPSVTRPFAYEGLPRIKVAVVGVSTGGPATLANFFSLIPDKLPVPVLVVQHMPAGFTSILADKLKKSTGKDVREAKDGERALCGTIYIAPGGKHLEVESRGDEFSLKLTDGPPVQFCRPSVDVLFESCARAFGSHTLAFVLTGMGRDGQTGAKSIKDAGGIVLVQDENSSVVWGMPKAVIDAGAYNKILPLPELAGELAKYSKNSTNI